MKNILITFTFLILMINLSFAQTKEEKQKSKEETATQEYEATKSLIESGEYKFIPDWAITLKGKRINLTANYGYLIINKEIAEADLPYFGIAQTPSYSGDGGIKFNNEEVVYQIEYNDKKQTINVRFKANHKSESYKLILSVLKSGNSHLNISSSKRNSISYSGKITKPINSK